MIMTKKTSVLGAWAKKETMNTKGINTMPTCRSVTP